MSGVGHGEVNNLYIFTDTKSKILYVGITKDIHKRLGQHLGKGGLFEGRDKNEGVVVYVAKGASRNEVAIYERYYIAKLSPPYNKAMKNGGRVSVELPPMNFERYDISKPSKKGVSRLTRKTFAGTLLDDIVTGHNGIGGNKWLASIASGLAVSGMGIGNMHDLLHLINDRYISPPLSIENVEFTYRNTLKQERGLDF